MSEAQYYTQPATKADLEQAQAIVRFIQPLLVTAGSGMGHGLQEARDLDGYLRDRLAVADVRLRPDYGRAFRNSSQYHRFLSRYIDVLIIQEPRIRMEVLQDITDVLINTSHSVSLAWTRYIYPLLCQRTSSHALGQQQLARAPRLSHRPSDPQLYISSSSRMPQTQATHNVNDGLPGNHLPPLRRVSRSPQPPQGDQPQYSFAHRFRSARVQLSARQQAVYRQTVCK